MESKFWNEYDNFSASNLQKQTEKMGQHLRKRLLGQGRKERNKVDNRGQMIDGG